MVNGHPVKVLEKSESIFLRGRWFFDIETDGLLDQLTKIHCIVLRHMDTDEVQTYGPDEIKAGLFTLMNAEEICGHNVIAFDIPALQKVYPGFDVLGIITDTLVMSRLMKTTLYEDDAKRQYLHQEPKDYPKKLFGSHGLKAWGLRLSDFKGDYDGGWETYSEEMLKYCVQDTQVTKALHEHLMTMGFSEESIMLEHSLATICLEIGNNGWTFDVQAAGKLYAKLCQERNDISEGLDSLFDPWEVTEDFYPKSNNATRGYVKDELFVKSKTVYFNPGSRRHIEHCLRRKYGWKPTKFTTTSGHAQIDETVLGELDYPEAQLLAKYFLLQKRIGQLAEGPQAWLKKADDDGRIRHTIVSGGTISGRAAHRSPNLAQVPKAGLLYGKECRDLFSAPPGWTLVGVDLDGLELRMLAHFLDDGGEYAKQILSGDIHQYNAQQIGSSRTVAKSFIYSVCFGAGDALVGKIAGGGPKEGKALKAAFNKNIPAFAKLQSNLKKASQRGYLNGLDGRKLFIREERKLLSQLLQSSGAVVCKKWVELTHTAINQKYTSDQVIIQGWIHDELQIGCATEEVAEDVLKIAILMARDTGRHFKTTIPISASGVLAQRWTDTH